MRIPPSVFVMSLVVAVPFGLAVKDTLHPPKTRAEIEAEKEAQYEADMERQAQADREAEEQRTQTVFGGLLGDKGKLGTYLDGLAIGTPEDQAEAIKDRTTNASDMLYLTYSAKAGRVDSIMIEANNDCSELTKAVRTKWGADNRWIDPATHTRAQYEEDLCQLTLDRYVDVEQFIDKTTTASIPVGALGKPLDEIGDDLALTSPNLVSGDDNVHVQFTIDDNSKITGMSASFKLDVDGDAVLRARLQQLFGKGTQDPDTGEWDYKGKVPVHYAYTSAHGYLDIGKP
jgi:hypothetical protein